MSFSLVDNVLDLDHWKLTLERHTIDHHAYLLLFVAHLKGCCYLETQLILCDSSRKQFG